MRLSKLDIAGFKSFAKKTELRFSNGITAVIGPNGSGKSNIADAVRWVLGEQSAKALRGTKMEDVIFNGTQTKRAQSFCEVTLTFENADHKLPTDYSEVAITRRVYRSGESEYCINGTTCRLKDVLELFRDTGIGKDGYSIISQGKVDEILSNKSDDRRAALEEAAGVMRFRVRKEEAERKLDHTEKNMVRIKDILDELESRIGPLSEQSQTARQFLKLRDELKDLEVNMFLYQTDRGNERLSSLKAAIEQMSDELLLNQESDKTLQAESRILEERASNLDRQLSEQQNELLKMLSQVEAQAGECKLLMERKENAKNEQKRIETEMVLEYERENRLKESVELISQTHTDENKRIELDAQIEEGTRKLESMDALLSSREQELEDAKNAIMEAMNRLSDAKSSQSRFDAMINALNERLSVLKNDEQLIVARHSRLEQEAENARHEINELSEQRSKLDKELFEVRKNRTKTEERYSNVSNELRENEQRQGALESRFRVLSEMIKSREGYQNSVKLLMRDAQADAELGCHIYGVVAELLRVPKEYEAAIDITLGGTLQNIVTENAEDAKACIEHLRKKGYGRATFLPISMLNSTPINGEERRLLSADGVIGLASELVSADKGLEKVKDYLLGRTVIVKDLDSGISLKKRSKNAFHIATLQGDFISTGGTMTGGSTQKKHFGLLGREREVEELKKAINELKERCDSQKSELESIKKELLLVDVQADGFTSEIHSLDTKIAVSAEKREIIARDIENAEGDGARLLQERESITENISELTEQKEQSLRIAEDIDKSNTASREDVIAMQRGLSEKRLERERVSSELTDLLVLRMAMQKEADAKTAERERILREIDTAREKISDLKTQSEKLKQTHIDIEARLAEMEGSLSVDQGAVSRAKEEQSSLEKERNELYERITQYRNNRDTLAETYRNLDERKHKNELAVGRLEMELENLQNKIWDDYELTYENALALRHDFAVGTTNSRIAQLRSQIRELGDINVSSIEDYAAVSERYESLNTQYNDLCKAKEDLHTLIAQLCDTMEEVFSAEFKKVQENFHEVFSELFGGGHAELKLSDPESPLTCDIDIIAQPPGKKLQLLSLLSGGERALTAIALLFAMLRLKAPAFCVLDEIETSLDEANVSRFASYLKTYSQDTQFIIITHRKGSMEVCDSLYGVAMEEKGISTIVSAKFEEAS